MKERLYAITLFLAALVSGPALADATGEARLRDQLRQTATQLRSLQAENVELKAKLEEAQKLAEQPAPAPQPVDTGEADQLREALRSQTSRSAALEAQATEFQNVVGQWQQSHAQAVELAKARDAEAKKYEALYREVDGRVKGCDDKNARLVRISDELLERYENKGVWDAMKEREPLTGLQRVELEKLAQEYRGRIIEADVKTPSPPAASETASNPSEAATP